MLRRNESSDSLAFVLTRVLPAVVLTTVAGLAVYALLLWAVVQTDHGSFRRQEKLVALVVSKLRTRIAHDQESSTVWDEAVQRVRADDTSWIDDNLGTWMHTYFGLDDLFVLNPKNDPIYAFANGRISPLSAYQGIAPIVAPLIRLMREDLRRGGPPEPGGPFLSLGVADLMMIDGHPAIVSIKPIVSESGKIVQTPGSEYLHIAIRLLDRSFAQIIARNYLVDELHFALRPADEDDTAAYPLKNNAGETIGYFVWDPYRPGSAVLAQAAPALEGFMGIALLTVLGFLAAVRNRSLKLRASEARIRYMAFHDLLTDLPNRPCFEDRVDATLAGSPSARLALIYVDLDSFKQVNDTLGHPVGDQLIRAFATRIRSLVDPPGMVARVGGDEFAIMLTDIAGREEVERLCQRILGSVRQPFAVEETQLFIGVSLGIACAPQDGTSRVELLRKADIALYHAKSTGRSRYVFFDIGMEDALQLRREIERDLPYALEAKDQFTLHYQPICKAASHEIIGFEALLRWQHPQRGLIAPEIFIPIAEEAGFIEKIGEYVLRSACTAAQQWPGKMVAVNASAVELAHSGYAAKVAAILHQAGLRPELLELEITETAANRPISAASANVAALRELGVSIAIDDFGLGFSSMARLQQLQVDRVKIDRSFVHGFGGGNGDEAIVQAIVDLAHAKGLRVTAEGVETPMQCERLTTMGCDELQGFIFSVARPSSDIAALLAGGDAAQVTSPGL
ncbi:putative bifunctional diguanylate cyclase/phosphodiesterase [Acidisoma sp. C75]